MVWASLVEDYMPDHDQQLLSPSRESTGKRVLTSHVDEALSYPLPELFLRSPELILIRANYSSVLLHFHAGPSDEFLARHCTTFG